MTKEEKINNLFLFCHLKLKNGCIGCGLCKATDNCNFVALPDETINKLYKSIEKYCKYDLLNLVSQIRISTEE